MRRFSFAKLYIIAMLIWWAPSYAASIQSYLIDSREFYSLSPKQQSLSEQFSAVVNSPPDPLNVNQTHPVNIVMLLSGNSRSIRNYSLLKTFNKRMAELGIDYRLDNFFLAPNHYDVNIVTQIKRKRPDYLVVTELDFVQSRFIEQILLQGRTKVIFYNMSTPLKNWQNHAPFMYIGFDQVKNVDMLASYLDRQLPKKAKIAALISHSGHVTDRRCDAFLNAMTAESRTLDSVRVVEDDPQNAYQETIDLLKQKQPDFIFGCTQNISDGIVKAIHDTSNNHVQTNSWGQSKQEIENLSHHQVMASVVFMWDDLAIAISEAIKKDMEGDTVPKLYIARASLMSSELDQDSLKLMMQQAFHYSAVFQ